MAIQENPVPGINESEGQQRLEEAKGAEAFRGYQWQGYDPKKDEAEPVRKKKAPDVMTAPVMLHRYYMALVVGKLNNVLATRDPEGGDCGDEGAAIVRYVEDVMGLSREALKPIVLHKEDGKPWATWYGPQTRLLAAAMYDAFRDRLAGVLKEKPFVFDPTPVFREDHLERADRANFL